MPISRCSASTAWPPGSIARASPVSSSYFDGDPLAGLAERDPALPGRVSERFRMAFDYVGPLTLSGSPRRRVFIYFDYRPAPPSP